MVTINKLIEPDNVFDYLLTCPPNTKLYFGSDSERFRIKGRWYRDVTAVIVVHIGGSHGCKIFGEVLREEDFEKNKARPIMRMMAEVYAVSALFNRMRDVIDATGFEVEVHLDINPDLKFGSSVALQQAIGYIQASCNVTPLVKPDAFSASYCADRYKEIESFKSIKGFERLSFRKKRRQLEAAV